MFRYALTSYPLGPALTMARAAAARARTWPWRRRAAAGSTSRCLIAHPRTLSKRFKGRRRRAQIGWCDPRGGLSRRDTCSPLRCRSSRRCTGGPWETTYIAWRGSRFTSVARGHRGIAVRYAAAMRGIVLPVASPHRDPSAIEIEPVTGPVPMVPAPEWPEDGKPKAETDRQPTQDHDARRRQQIKRRIVRPRPGAVDHGWIVVGHVDHVWAWRLNLNVLVFDRHCLLRRRGQGACGRSPMPQALNGDHDRGLL